MIKTCYKGDCPLEYHLGCAYKRDPDGTLVGDPRRYVDKIIESYERMFGEKPKKSKSPLEAGDHPELDTSEFAQNMRRLSIKLSLDNSNGSGICNVNVMAQGTAKERTLTSLRRIFSCPAYLPVGAIRFRTHEPDYSSIQEQGFDWERPVSGNVKKHIPPGISKALGKFVVTTHYVDTNLLHDCVTGRSVTAVLHLIYGIPTDWYSKSQATAETATYGSEFVAARGAVDQIVDLRYTLMYLGVPYQEQKLPFWGQAICVNQLYNPKLHHIQEAPSCLIPLHERIFCHQLCCIYLERSENQPCRHHQETLGICKGLGTNQALVLLEKGNR